MNISSFMINGISNNIKSYSTKKNDRAKKIAKSSSISNKHKQGKDYNENKDYDEGKDYDKKDTGNIFDDYI